MKAVHCYLVTWIVFCIPTQVIEACSGDGVGNCNKTTSSPSSTTLSATILAAAPENHRLKCKDTEAHYIGCLNGGTCLASVIDDIRYISCQCRNMYAGRRCETIDVRIILGREERERVKTPYLVLGIAIPVLLLILLVSYAAYKNRKSARKRNSQPIYDSSNTKDAEKSLVKIYVADETSLQNTYITDKTSLENSYIAVKTS